MEANKEPAVEQRIVRLEAELRGNNSKLHKFFYTVKRTDADLERELKPILRKMVEDKDGYRALWFVKTFSAKDIAQAHGIDFSREYDELERDSHVIWTGAFSAGPTSIPHTVVSIKETEKNRQMALRIVGKLAG